MQFYTIVRTAGMAVDVLPQQSSDQQFTLFCPRRGMSHRCTSRHKVHFWRLMHLQTTQASTVVIIRYSSSLTKYLTNFNPSITILLASTHALTWLLAFPLHAAVASQNSHLCALLLFFQNVSYNNKGFCIVEETIRIGGTHQ